MCFGEKFIGSKEESAWKTYVFFSNRKVPWEHVQLVRWIEAARPRGCVQGERKKCYFVVQNSNKNSFTLWYVQRWKCIIKKFHACSDKTWYKQTMTNKFLYAILRAATWMAKSCTEDTWVRCIVEKKWQKIAENWENTTYNWNGWLHFEAR